MTTDEILTELHDGDDFLMLAKSLSEFGNRELVPYLRTLGREEFPARFIPLAGQKGFLGTAIPLEYGGQGGTLEGLLPVLEGIAACDGSLALTLAAHESLATTHIMLGGNEAQKRKYLPELTSGRMIGAWCLTEPQAGSNIFNDMRTRLLRTPAGWRLRGEKTFITNGSHADIFVVLARAINEAGTDLGITACIVERKGNEAGITHTQLHNKMGMNRSDTAALKFDDLQVAEHLIMEPMASGGAVARRVLLRGRVGIGALALGLARDSLERAAAYAKTRQVAGGSLFEQPLTQAKLARMEASLWTAWQGVRAAARCANQAPFKIQAAVAKVFATEAALKIADEAVQILGGYGYMSDYKVEQNYRDARLLTIGEGASEILLLAIGRSLLENQLADVLPTLANLDAVKPSDTTDSLWGSSWRALQLAAESLQIVRDELAAADDSAAPWQIRAAGLADLGTSCWVQMQAVASGVALRAAGPGSDHRIKLIKNYAADQCVELCHQAAELLRNVGLSDATVCSNYIQALQLSAGLGSSTSQPVHG